MEPTYWLKRASNGIRKVASGLRPFGESVWPGVRNDLFVAHESIYRFFAKFASGQRILDGGCGTGYGAFHLAKSGALSVTAIDADRLSIRYARKHFVADNLRFDVGDLEELPYQQASFDLVVTSNALEHLRNPSRFLQGLRRVLTSEGTAVIAVPPILTDGDVSVHARIHYHRSNLTVDQWLQMFLIADFGVTCYAHGARPEILPRFESVHRSRLSVDDFEVVATSRDGMYSVPSITAVFVLQPH
jgi:2-polyprenyl-3-methyl-5-hydroxy-6-metoxy-1,4-benzoquinol methylase